MLFFPTNTILLPIDHESSIMLKSSLTVRSELSVLGPLFGTIVALSAFIIVSVSPAITANTLTDCHDFCRNVLHSEAK